jgi:hypothetical protein
MLSHFKKTVAEMRHGKGKFSRNSAACFCLTAYILIEHVGVGGRCAAISGVELRFQCSLHRTKTAAQVPYLPLETENPKDQADPSGGKAVDLYFLVFLSPGKCECSTSIRPQYVPPFAMRSDSSFIIRPYTIFCPCAQLIKHHTMKMYGGAVVWLHLF